MAWNWSSPFIGPWVSNTKPYVQHRSWQDGKQNSDLRLLSFLRDHTACPCAMSNFHFDWLPSFFALPN